MTDIAQLVSDLQGDEGFSAFTYDDATGKRVGPGSLIQGHITGGYGTAFDVAPLTQPEAVMLLTSRATGVVNNLLSALPWVVTLSEPRQRALANMAYNLGIAGLESFTTFLSLMRSGDFADAANDLRQTKWATQVGARATRIANTIQTG